MDQSTNLKFKEQQDITRLN